MFSKASKKDTNSKSIKSIGTVEDQITTLQEKIKALVSEPRKFPDITERKHDELRTNARMNALALYQSNIDSIQEIIDALNILITQPGTISKTKLQSRLTGLSNMLHQQIATLKLNMDNTVIANMNSVKQLCNPIDIFSPTNLPNIDFGAMLVIFNNDKYADLINRRELQGITRTPTLLLRYVAYVVNKNCQKETIKTDHLLDELLTPEKKLVYNFPGLDEATAQSINSALEKPHFKDTIEQHNAFEQNLANKFDQIEELDTQIKKIDQAISNMTKNLETLITEFLNLLNNEDNFQDIKDTAQLIHQYNINQSLLPSNQPTIKTFYSNKTGIWQNILEKLDTLTKETLLQQLCNSYQTEITTLEQTLAHSNITAETRANITRVSAESRQATMLLTAELTEQLYQRVSPIFAQSGSQDISNCYIENLAHIHQLLNWIDPSTLNLEQQAKRAYFLQHIAIQQCIEQAMRSQTRDDTATSEEDIFALTTQAQAIIYRANSTDDIILPNHAIFLGTDTTKALTVMQNQWHSWRIFCITHQLRRLSHEVKQGKNDVEVSNTLANYHQYLAPLVSTIGKIDLNAYIELWLAYCELLSQVKSDMIIDNNVTKGNLIKLGPPSTDFLANFTLFTTNLFAYINEKSIPIEQTQAEQIRAYCNKHPDARFLTTDTTSLILNLLPLSTLPVIDTRQFSLLINYVDDVKDKKHACSLYRLAEAHLNNEVLIPDYPKYFTSELRLKIIMTHEGKKYFVPVWQRDLLQIKDEEQRQAVTEILKNMVLKYLCDIIEFYRSNEKNAPNYVDQPYSLRRYKLISSTFIFDVLTEFEADQPQQQDLNIYYLAASELSENIRTELYDLALKGIQIPATWTLEKAKHKEMANNINLFRNTLETQGELSSISNIVKEEVDNINSRYCYKRSEDKSSDEEYLYTFHYLAYSSSCARARSQLDKCLLSKYGPSTDEDRIKYIAPLRVIDHALNVLLNKQSSDTDLSKSKSTFYSDGNTTPRRGSTNGPKQKSEHDKHSGRGSMFGFRGKKQSVSSPPPGLNPL